jgi:hypothetical protein
MTEIGVIDALDGAQAVKVDIICGVQFAQVWHGGTTVNVYNVKNARDGFWREVTCWSMSDERGRPVERDEIVKHMRMHFDNLRELEEEDR